MVFAMGHLFEFDKKLVASDPKVNLGQIYSSRRSLEDSKLMLMYQKQNAKCSPKVTSS
jgi:hypothetical protein